MRANKNIIKQNWENKKTTPIERFFELMVVNKMLEEHERKEMIKDIFKVI